MLIAADKVQSMNIGRFLGAIIEPKTIKLQKISLAILHLKTLNDFQKLLGDFNWLRPYLKIPTAELKPLFDVLEGDTALTSPRELTVQEKEALLKVEKAITKAQLYRVNYTQPLALCILATRVIPTGVLWQEGPLLWIHAHATATKTLYHYPTAVAEVAQTGTKAAITHFGISPQKLIVPYTAHQVEVLCATLNEWAILRCTFTGILDNHLPKHPLLQFITTHPVIFNKCTSRAPLPGALDVYTDGSKTGKGCYLAQGKIKTFMFEPNAPQVVECLVVLKVFQAFPQSINIVSDSFYVVNAVTMLETAGMNKLTSCVANILLAIQQCIWDHTEPFFIQHIRAHTLLPGPMV